MSKILVSIALVLALAACSTTSAPRMTEFSAGLSEHTLVSNGLVRTYQLYRPASADAAAPAVFALHGSRGSGKEMRTLVGKGFETLADQYGFIVVYPDGVENHWNDCRASADYLANTRDINDPLFFEDLINELTNTQSIDRTQAFITGLSNGGHMAYRIALEKPDLFQAYAALIASLPEERNLDCGQSRQAVNMLIMNGTEDPINPFKGGMVTLGGNSSRGPVMSTRETALYWAGLAGHRRPPEETTFAEHDGNEATSISQKTWSSEGAHTVSLITLHGSGHVFPVQGAKIPSKYAAILGTAAGDINGAEEVVRFFRLNHAE
ncbi:MAG: PHB depolymerase family esterase [Pseudomonadales bacterium]